jgi:hypothetical protein
VLVRKGKVVKMFDPQRPITFSDWLKMSTYNELDFNAHRLRKEEDKPDIRTELRCIEVEMIRRNTE